MERFNKRLQIVYLQILGLLGFSSLTGCGGGSSGQSREIINQEIVTDDQQVTELTDDSPSDSNQVTNIPANLAPSNLTVPNSVLEGATVVGMIRFSDEDPNSAVIKVTGPDRVFFEIQGQQLKLLNPADYDEKENYDIIVSVTDDSGLSTQNSFIISVEEVVEDTPVIRVEAIEIEPGVHRINVFVDAEHDPSNLGIESFLINVAFDADLAGVVEGSFETQFEISEQNISIDGNLSYLGATLSPTTDYNDKLMSFDIAVEEGQDPENLLLEFFQVSIDDVSFANTEISIA